MTELLTIIPWICLLLVFSGMLSLCWKLAGGQHDLSTLLAQALAQEQPHPVAVPMPLQPALPKPAVPAPPAIIPTPAKPAILPVAVPAGPFADYPAWFQKALPEIGNHEVGVNAGPAIQRYINLSHCGSLGDPWCAIFANAMLESAGVPGTRSPSSQSFRTDANFVALSGPAKGAIVVYWRGTKASGLGHVGFYRGENASSIWTLGGNENDMVQIEALAKDSASFGLVGYFWPKSVALPQIGAVMMPAGSPVSVQAPPIASAPAPAHASGAVQTNIIATYFSTNETENRMTAYGPALDDNTPGVALPFHFPNPRPQVVVTNTKNGKSVVCQILDVGPWNINDPYWTTGARPQAETGFDLGQVSNGKPRKTNGAGIDLNIGAMQAIGIDGKGIVSWSFVDPTASTIPNVV